MYIVKMTYKDSLNLLCVEYVSFRSLHGAHSPQMDSDVCKIHFDTQVSRDCQITIDIVKNELPLFISISVLFIG